MSKFHINPETGNPGSCTAVFKCPFGDMDADHYPTPEIARVAYEIKMKTQEFISLSKDYKASLPERKPYINPHQIEDIKNGVFNNLNVSFTRDDTTQSGPEKWNGKITGEPEDVDLSVTFTKSSVESSITWNGKSNPIDSIPLENDVELSEVEKGEFLTKAVNHAKSKYEKELAKDRKEVFARAKEFSKGNITINNFPMQFVPFEDDNGYVEGSRWSGVDMKYGTDNRPEITVYNGNADLRLSSTIRGRTEIIHRVRMKDGATEFENSIQAARFFIEAEEIIKNHKWD